MTQGLTRDDFTITEEKRPQRIVSFEEPKLHAIAGSVPGDAAAASDLPRTIFVLDFLNTSFVDAAYIRYSIRQYLKTQPDELAAPAELMVLGNDSLEMVQGYTRNKEELLSALDHVPAMLPYKFISASFWVERFSQSIYALQQMALQSAGVPGRKNIIWVGHGGPGVTTSPLDYRVVRDLDRYVRTTTNMLVDARVSLFVIYPGLKAASQPAFTLSEAMAHVDLGDGDPFAGDINFGLFVNETGGRLFYNRNDVDREIGKSEVLGANYYTLTYQPQGGASDGKFRRVRVTLRNPNLTVITKAGYYAPDQNAPVDPREQRLLNLVQAAESTIPFQALNVSITDVVRHPDAQTTSFTIVLRPKIAGWEPTADGKSTVNVMLAATSLSRDRDVLAFKRGSVAVTLNTQNESQLAATTAKIEMTLRTPRKMQTVRVALQLPDSGRMGTAELDRRAIEAAPTAPTPAPVVQTRPHA